MPTDHDEKDEGADVAVTEQTTTAVLLVPPVIEGVVGNENAGVVDDEGREDLFSRLKNQMARYYIESNPTIKCRNCK